MKSVLVETRFDCVTDSEGEFVAQLLIGDMQSVDVENGEKDVRFRISFEPLFQERNIGGIDSFQALCLAIELVRDALTAFRMHGGHVYFHNTKSPINLNSVCFSPIREPISPRFLGKASPESGKTKSQMGRG
jgi:hypothetical protein